MGRYRARVGQGDADLRAARALRHRAFPGSGAAQGIGGCEGAGFGDADAHDRICRHILIEDTGLGLVVGCFRWLPLANGSQIDRSYSAQHYDLSRLHTFRGALAEMGRFCIHPDHAHPDIVRIAWAAMARMVDDDGIRMLFGCASFQGTCPQKYRHAFAALHARHQAPPRWRPMARAAHVHRFAALLQTTPQTPPAAATMPPLLRSYLAMGAWVSDHAVVDHALDTLHVFTGLEIGAVPPARARLLRSVAQAAQPIDPAPLHR